MMTALEAMKETSETPPPDYGLIAPISLPPSGRLPAPDVAATTGDYDTYFRLRRKPLRADEWAATCQDVSRAVSNDLDQTSLEETDKTALISGLAVANEITVRRCLAGSESGEEDAPDD